MKTKKVKVLYVFALLVGLAHANTVIYSNPVAQTEGKAEDVLIDDFERTDFSGWTIEGEAFGSSPVKGLCPGNRYLCGWVGKGFVNSQSGGWHKSGRMISSPFLIQRKYINFLISGHTGSGIELLVDGVSVRHATGSIPPKASAAEVLFWNSWDVAEFMGKNAEIKLSAAPDAHLNIDQIVQSEQRFQEAPARREFAITNHYLHLPVKNGALERQMRFVVDGKTEREFMIEWAVGEPDYWVFADVSQFKGRKLVAEVVQLEPTAQLDRIVQSDVVPDADGMYQEKYRPLFHFSTRRGWQNDPNGLVYYKGEYHLFYQHNPFGVKFFSTAAWGHAVSRDLVHWEELDDAIYPPEFGYRTYSGSAVIDEKNTAGFKTGTEDVMVAFIALTGMGPSLASSVDRGRTFTLYQGNPVNRFGGDPRVIWYAPGQHWVMVTCDKVDGQAGFVFSTSPDLKNWTKQSRSLSGFWECPEIFELPLDGDLKQKKWVVYCNKGSQYVVGDFDGKNFSTNTSVMRYSYGNGSAAAQTFNNIPPEDGRRIQIGWGTLTTQFVNQSSMLGMPFSQQMTFPVELTLRSTEAGPQLFINPVKEIEKLYAETRTINEAGLSSGPVQISGLDGENFDLELSITTGSAREISLIVRGIPLAYSVSKKELSCMGKVAPLNAVDGKIKLRMLVDRLSLEIFANDGRIYLPMTNAFDPAVRGVSVSADGSGARLSGSSHTLTPIWPRVVNR